MILSFHGLGVVFLSCMFLFVVWFAVFAVCGSFSVLFWLSSVEWHHTASHHDYRKLATVSASLALISTASKHLHDDLAKAIDALERKKMDLHTVANSCGVPIACFTGSRPALANALETSSEFSALCTKVLDYRLEKKQDCCTSLKHITTWSESRHWESDSTTGKRQKRMSAQPVPRRRRNPIQCVRWH